MISNLAFFVRGRTLPGGFALSEDRESVVSELAARLLKAGIIESVIPLESSNRMWTFRAGPVPTEMDGAETVRIAYGGGKGIPVICHSNVDPNEIDSLPQASIMVIFDSPIGTGMGLFEPNDEIRAILGEDCEASHIIF